MVLYSGVRSWSSGRGVGGILCTDMCTDMVVEATCSDESLHN